MARLDEKALLVKLSISQWAGRKEDKKVTKEVEENHGAHDAGRYHKHLLAKAALEKIQKTVNAARTYHYQNTLPWTIDGQDILTTALYLDYTQAMAKHKATFENDVKEFLDNYPQYIEEAKKRLNGLFNPADYPNAEKVKNLFSFSIQFFPIPATQDFRMDLQAEEIERIKAETEKALKATEQAAIADLWERLYKTVSHAAERLNDPKAIFRNTLIENISGLCNLLPRLNFTDDPDLEKMRREVENKLLKFTPDTLREDADAREETARQARELLKGIKAHVTPQEPEPQAQAPAPAPPAPIQTETETPAPETSTPSPEEEAKAKAEAEAKAKFDALQDGLF